MRSLHDEPEREYPADPSDFWTQAGLVGIAGELDEIIRGDALHTLHEEIGYRARQRRVRQAATNAADYQYHLELAGEVRRLLDMKEQGAVDRCRAAAKAVVFGEHRADVLGAIVQVAQEVRDREAAKTLARTGRKPRPARKAVHG